jgi:hypothetical protein
VAPPFGLGRYVLYEDGTFTWFLNSTALDGRYAYEAPGITFTFAQGQGRWGATGTLRGDSLHVTVNEVMRGADFMDGLYVRPRGTP